MTKLHSIKQNYENDALPDFRNIGVTLRILLISNVLAFLQAILLTHSWEDLPRQTMQMATLFTPVLLCMLICLWIVQPWLKKIPYYYGVAFIQTLVVVMTITIYVLGGELYQKHAADTLHFDLLRYTLASSIVCSILLLYFRLRSRLLSQSLNEARLQMLRARIRPHFFFNCINAVLGIVRAQPKKAETALEDMADLFRMAMAEAQDFTLLQQEIQLCKQYLALEQLRMGDRLQVKWHIDDLADDTLIPPFMLQPLLENAVYHGIETMSQGGHISVSLQCQHNTLKCMVENPCTSKQHKAHAGNKMALKNIRSRLSLLFDTDASYAVESGENFYRVQISIPYLKKGS